MECKHCKGKEIAVKKKGMHTGAYCGNCGKWLKWLNPDECESYGVMAKENNVCRRCGGTVFEKKSRGVHVGEYCMQCGTWIRWVKK